MSEKKYFRKTFTVSFLIEEEDLTSADLTECLQEAYDGRMVQEFQLDKEEIQELNAKEVVAALNAAGSDPGFFNLDNEGDPSEYGKYSIDLFYENTAEWKEIKFSDSLERAEEIFETYKNKLGNTEDPFTHVAIHTEIETGDIVQLKIYPIDDMEPEVDQNGWTLNNQEDNEDYRNQDSSEPGHPDNPRSKY